MLGRMDGWMDQQKSETASVTWTRPIMWRGRGNAALNDFFNDFYSDMVHFL